MTKNDIGRFAIEALKGKVPAYVIRGMDSCSHQGGDIDIVVPPKMTLCACKLVGSAALSNGLSIICFKDIGYVSSITLLSLNGAVVKLDFINGFSWYGFSFDELIANPFESSWERFHKNWTDSRISGLLTFYQKIMASGEISSSEWERIKAFGADEIYLADFACAQGLPISRKNIHEHKIDSLTKWKLRAASCGANNLILVIIWFVRICLKHLKFKIGFGSRQGFVLSISGMDGSGKSTLVEKLLAAYRQAGGNQPILLHLLPNWLPLPHQLFRRKKTSSNYTRPYSEPPVTSKLSGFTRLTYYLVAFIITRIWLSFATIRGNQIIMDRSFVDFVSDLTRARIPEAQIPAWLMRLIKPVGQLFYLDASPDVVVARKGELTIEKASSLKKNYHSTCQIAGAEILNGNNTPDAIFKELLGHISHEYMLRIENAVIHQRAG